LRLSETVTDYIRQEKPMSSGTPVTTQLFEVKGTIRLANSSPARGIKVSAFDRDLRAEQLLGQSETDAAGFYYIQYSAGTFAKSETGSADLVVKAFALDGSVLAASAVLFNAPRSAVIDVTISAQVWQSPTLFETVGQAVKPLLDGLSLQELREDTHHQDLSFLSGETGLDKTVLARFVLAQRLAQPSLPAEFWFVLLGGALFQFAEGRSLVDQLSTFLASLPSLDSAAVRKALNRGFNSQEIPMTFQVQTCSWIEAFAKFVTNNSVSEKTAPSFLQSALDAAGIRTAAKREAAARLFNESMGLTSEVVSRLEQAGSFSKKEIADLRTSFQLADLTHADFAVVQMVKNHFDVRSPEKIPVLATYPEADWVRLVKAQHDAGKLALPFEIVDINKGASAPAAEIYGKTLAKQFRETFPTMAFAGGLRRAMQNGGSRGLRHAPVLNDFLARHNGFELLTTPIDDFLKTHPVTSDISSNGDFRLELKAIQRVFKLAPTFEATDALLADNLHSAQQIYRLGETEFVRRYAGTADFTAENARQVWNRAADTHAAVLTIVADLKSLDAEAVPQVLKHGTEALSMFPKWDNLFQTGDICACEDCRSILSPAAYFADALKFLNDRMSATPGVTVKDILFARRPDLGYLELNCPNAFTTLPYVDVVCEVLEGAVAGDANDVELPGFTTMSADPVAAKNAVAAALATQQINMGADFSLIQVKTTDPTRWVAHGEDATFLLIKKTTNFFARLLPNTKAGAEQLRAYPQYVNPKAYLQLRQARFPFALPFDIFAEEVRAAFQKCNLQRWSLMRTFRGTSSPNNPTDGDVAAECFGISADPAAAFDENRLILIADTTAAGQQTVWGEAGNNDWLAVVTSPGDPKLPDTLANVQKFLQKAGLEYEELLAVLDLKYVNPAGDIAVQHLDASCDTDKKVLTDLDPAKLDRIHRFLRLWRKLRGWKMWELDLVLRHPRIGNGTLDEAFLIRLFDFNEVRQTLGGRATVEQVCAVVGNLNTEPRFTGLYEKREGALYQNLFLNKRLIHPLDPAFQIDSGTGDLPPGETITAHQPVVLAALGIRESDLIVLKTLAKASDGLPYINDDLNLGNLSFLWQHAWLSKLLKFEIGEWAVLLKLNQQDISFFASPADALSFLVVANSAKASGFSSDALSWILAADRNAKAAMPETVAAGFLSGLRKQLQAVQAQYNQPAPTDVDGLTARMTALLQQLRRDEAATQFFLGTLRNDIQLSTTVAGLPTGFDFPPAIKATIHIRYNEAKHTISFTGLMTDMEKTTLLGVSGIASYQDAIEDIFNRPRLTLKFFEPVFTAPLYTLSPTMDFQILPDQSLASRMFYDADLRVLGVNGILSKDDKAALDALSADAAYRAAVASLASQPGMIVPPDPRISLVDTDLQFPLEEHLAANLSRAAIKAMAYLSKALSKKVVVQSAAAELGLTEALCERLLTDYPILPETLIEHFTGSFAATSGVVDYATLKLSFDAWFWAGRVAAVWKKWKLNLTDFVMYVALQSSAQLIDFGTLPLDNTKPVASLAKFLRATRLLKIRDAMPETGISFLEILGKLAGGSYPPADFAADVQLLNNAWLASDAELLTSSLDLTYPGDYLQAETWDRLRQAFYFLGNLNAGTTAVEAFAATTMTESHARTIKELLRSKVGVDVWLGLSAEIQKALRERKRDSLTAYLLAQSMPADAPSAKWENTDDLYSYYLLDVEMASCQLTSRLVQASGSVQLFVQRCFMGLEPQVKVQADGPQGNSAWRWWTWMRKYRVWEANRKVFLWPENWIEPELKQDRSSLFKELEHDLQQNEVNEDAVENAFENFLKKLDGVAQLDIAGFYQEDDGDDTTLHVFARTKGGDPHQYYYRRYDYREWTPWEKVELDIQGDYLIPAVVNKRLFLFWPVFTEVPDEASNSTVSTPAAHESGVPLQKSVRRHRVQLASSDYRKGQWTPKKISKDYYQSSWITVVESVGKFYYFIPVDRTETDGRFLIQFGGYSLGSDGYEQAELFGAFDVVGCTGAPELVGFRGNFRPAIQPEWASVGEYQNPDKSYSAFMKWDELGSSDEFGRVVVRHDNPEDDFTLENVFSTVNMRYTPLLLQTPWFFRMSPPWHFSYLDRLFLNGLASLGLSNAVGLKTSADFPAPFGSWLPFFYNDKKRTFFVLPVLAKPNDGRVDGKDGNVLLYYPEVKKLFTQLEDYYAALIQKWLDSLDLLSWTADQRQQLDQLLWKAFPEEAPAPLPVASPYTPEEVVLVKAFIKRYLLRFFDRYLGTSALQLYQLRHFQFTNFYHPFMCDFEKLVNNPLKGIPALMSRETQVQDSGFSFRRTYQPTPWVVEPPTEKFYPSELVDFTLEGAYSAYNWELFFHAPLLIANSLSRNQRFEEARDWYHFIFNPIGTESSVNGGSPMSKYWITKPFFETTDPQYIQERIENILRLLAGDTSAPSYSPQAKKNLEDQVLGWRTHPFDPHRIAKYRTVAYQKTVVMKYLDNLIAWGDYLFRQDSMESINEATQLYIMAAEILGPRPKRIPPQAKPSEESFNELEDSFDKFSNALIEVENLIPPQSGNGSSGSDQVPLPMLYFCIPQNDKLLSYWDTVADRLFKVRHCMNIEGVVRELALFEPPIDPGALAKAVASGVDIGSVLANLNAPLPLYRFNIVLQKANEFCADVKSLGNALLAALQSQDSEVLNLLRQNQELRVLEAVKAVREQQIQEASDNLAALEKNKELAKIRQQYYENREFMSGGERAAIELAATALISQLAGTVTDLLAGGTSLIPDIQVGASGFGGSPHVTVKTGGTNVSNSGARIASSLYQVSSMLDKSASMVSTLAGYERRQNEWDFQRDLAVKEIEQMDQSIAAATLRVGMAKKELENHQLQIDNAKATAEFLSTKYTNQDLFQWQVGQISGVYFQSYQLAYDLATRAERCFRFELGVNDSNFIQFGHWDSLKKGLLAGEKLQYDLRRLESAYLEQNRREFELTKSVSLLMLDPLALVKLRETGRCFISLPEEIFDLDFPGHYFRRIKSVSLTMPCVVGPYTSISCTLRLTKNSIRINTDTGTGYPRNTDEQGVPEDDPRFVENNIPVKAIASSNGQNDSGVFELSFRDERYLPFEGAGAISAWSLELFNDTTDPDFGQPLRQFDYGTISDVILHLRYTAREDAGTFKNRAIAQLREYYAQDGTVPSARMITFRQDFPGQWYRFLVPPNPADGNVLEWTMSTGFFRILDAEKTLQVDMVWILARCNGVGSYNVVLTPPSPAVPNTASLIQASEYGGLRFQQLSGLGIEIDLNQPPATWQLKMTGPNGLLQAGEVEDMYLVLGYVWS
jgi:hypothetical protein